MPLAFNNELFPSRMSNSVTLTACHLNQSRVSDHLVCTSYSLSMTSLVLRDDIHIHVPSYVSSGTMPCLNQLDIASQVQSHMLVSPDPSCSCSDSPFSDATIPLSPSLHEMPSTSFHPSLVHENSLKSISCCGCFDANYNQNTFSADIKNYTFAYKT